MLLIIHPIYSSIIVTYYKKIILLESNKGKVLGLFTH